MKDESLTIAYAGTLNYHSPLDQERKKGAFSILKEFFWTYRVQNIDPSTRSALHLFQALSAIKKEAPDRCARLKLSLWGKIDPSFETLSRSLGIEDFVEIGGYMDRASSLERLRRADVLFLPLEKGVNGERPLFIPGKLYELLSLRKPILLLAGESDCKDIVEASGLGLVAEPDDPEDIREKLERLLEQRSSLESVFSPDETYLQGFSAERVVGELARSFDELHE